ncbi:MAG: HTTM domain-containing protein [Flavobacterium sp.]
MHPYKAKKFPSRVLSQLMAPIDNIQLILFRIVFGLLLFWHCIEAMTSDFVEKNFVQPKYTFSHIGMEWLQPLPGNGMYYYFGLMALSGLLISIGLFYRYSLGLFTILWWGAYLMQKTSYNNHYYLLILICIIMLFLPANRSHSADVKINPGIRQETMPNWCRWSLILQIAIVYFFSTVAKLYSGWLDGSFVKELLLRHAIPELGNLYQQKWFPLFIAYSGLLFDFLIVPLLLWKKTRKYAFAASIFFHIFNKMHLGIGIFPFLALSFSILFFPPEFFRKYFRTGNPKASYNPQKKLLLYFFIPFFIVQLLLPIRHYFIKGDVLWTEEGHRLSWRMMLRHKTGITKFIVVDNKTKKQEVYKLRKLLTKKQIRVMRTKPDMIWQTTQKIKEEYQRKGMDISIYVDSRVSVNGRPFVRLINPTADFTKVEWNYFFHNDWILPYKL